eukprot:364615-Chlamydomonas_euryale.AAC.8
MVGRYVVDDHGGNMGSAARAIRDHHAIDQEAFHAIVRLNKCCVHNLCPGRISRWEAANRRLAHHITEVDIVVQIKDPLQDHHLAPHHGDICSSTRSTDCVDQGQVTAFLGQCGRTACISTG